MLEWLSDNPFRKPSWCWGRAQGILAGEQPATSRRLDTKPGVAWIRRALGFLRLLQDCETILDQVAIAKRYPGVFWAWHCHVAQETARWELEARVLAGCDNYAVGEAMGLPATTVEAYTALFFDVREKLSHRGYVLHCVLGPAFIRGFSERDVDLLWKLYGYFYGPHMLNAMLSHTVNATHCPTSESVLATAQDSTIGSMLLKCDVAAKTIPVNSGTYMELLHAFNKFVEIQRSTEGGEGGQVGILSELASCLEQFGFSVAGHEPRTQSLVSSPALAYTGLAAELTTHERLQTNRGEELPYRDVLEAMQYPELPSAEETRPS